MMKPAFLSLAAFFWIGASLHAAPVPKAVPAPASATEAPAGPPKKQTLIPPPAMPDRPAAEPPPGVVIPAATPSAAPPLTVPSTPPPAAAIAPPVAPVPATPPTATATVPGAATSPATAAVPPGVNISSGADATALQQQLAEVEVPPAETEYIISEGETLGALASKVYGNEAYGAVLTNYNAVDAKKLKIGQTIKTPAIGQMLSECGFAVRFPEESLILLRVKKAYTEIEPQLNALKGTPKKAESVPDDLKKKLKELHGELEKARLAIIAKCAGLKPPESTLLQFRTAGDTMVLMSKGDLGKNDNNIQEVHRRLGLGVAYSIFWARSGFK